MRKKLKSTICLMAGLACGIVLLLTACSGSKDSKIQGIRVQNGDYAAAIDKAEIGDTFLLGTYEQDDDESNGKEPISWRVLDKNEDGLLLISEYILGYGAYDYDGGDMTWATCGTRESWNDFGFDRMFADDEKKHIAWRDVENGDNPEYGIDGGANTKDRLFYLSLDEVNKYFSDDADRCAVPTEYAKEEAIGSITESEYKWWLRTPGQDAQHAAYVSETGKVETAGIDVKESDEIGNRLALWLVKEEQVDIYGAAKLSYTEIADAEAGDFVLYGHYEQDGDKSDKEPIEWVVLAREDDKLLLLSRYILEKMRFGSTPYWEESEVREWLNYEFYKTAFDSDERDGIQRIVTSDKTSDFIFCLSAEEARGLFATNQERLAYITEYLRGNEFKAYRGRGDWWTRSVSTATNGKGVVPVEADGNVRSAGTNHLAPEEYTYTDIGVRPVLCVDISGAGADALNMNVFGYDSNHGLDNEPMPGGGGSNGGSGKCPNCGGSGVVKYYYGGSDLEAYLSGHDPYELGECPMCDGTGN